MATALLKRLLLIVTSVPFLCSVFGCSPSSEIRVGAYYSVDDGEGSFRVAKVLVTDDYGVHVSLFGNRWEKRPPSVDISELSLGTMHDFSTMGMGHLPLTRRGFLEWKPVLLQEGTVSESELDGYRYWKEEGGGYFGQ